MMMNNAEVFAQMWGEVQGCTKRDKAKIVLVYWVRLSTIPRCHISHLSVVQSDQCFVGFTKVVVHVAGLHGAAFGSKC